MAKVVFENKTYVEVSKSPDSDKMFITIAARDSKNASVIVAHSVELTKEQYEALIKE